MSHNINIAIAFHSGYGHTLRQAEAVLAGAASVAGASAKLYPVDSLDEAQWAELDAADAILFGAPTYMGSASAKFKGFMDESSKRWFSHAWKGKVAGGFTTSASQSGDTHLRTKGHTRCSPTFGRTITSTGSSLRSRLTSLAKRSPQTKQLPLSTPAFRRGK